MSLVELTKDNEIAIITVNNPPVNALSPGVPEGISECIDQVYKDDSIKVAIIIGSGTTFVAGADINEFGKITSGKTQRGIAFLPMLIRIEDCSKPVIMAIHGTAFGGGLELAMAGHYRIASPTAGGPSSGDRSRGTGDGPRVHRLAPLGRVYLPAR